MAFEKVDGFDGINGFTRSVCDLDSGDGIDNHVREELSVTNNKGERF